MGLDEKRMNSIKVISMIRKDFGSEKREEKQGKDEDNKFHGHSRLNLTMCG